MPSLSSAGKKKTKTTDRCGTCDGFVKKFGDGLVRTKGIYPVVGNCKHTYYFFLCMRSFIVGCNEYRHFRVQGKARDRETRNGKNREE